MPEQKFRGKREEYNEERIRKKQEKKTKEKEEKERIEKVSKVEITKPIIQKTAETEIKVKVPILKLEEPKVEIKEVKISKEIPHIEKEKLEVKVPIINLPPLVFEEKEIKLDKDVPLIESVERNALEIPLIKSREVRVRCVVPKFNSTIPVVRPRPQTRIRIPIYRILRTPAVKDIVLFDEKIDEELLEKLEEKIQTLEFQATVISKEAEPTLSGGGKIEDEPPEIIKFVFGGYSTRILARGPIVLLYKELEGDSTVGSFETICIRIFKEREGGEPGYFSIKKLDDFNLREIEKYVKPEGNIVRIDLDLLKKDAESKKKNVFEIISPEYLRETLSRFVVGDVSFLIFKTRDEKLNHHCKQVLGKLSASTEHPLKVVEITPQKMTVEQKKILTELAWGLSVKEIGTIMENPEWDRPFGDTLDDLFNKFGKTKHEEYLENLQIEKNGMYAQATNQHEGEESDLHLQIKWFIVKLLSEKYRLTSLLEIEGNIKTEEQLPKANIKPDIWDVKENSVYEIETLFSEDREGKTPQKKIYESIKKYEGTSIKEINVVLDNLTFLLHFKEILGVKKNIRDWEQKAGKKVEFFTLDLEKHKLIPLSNFLKRVKNLIT